MSELKEKLNQRFAIRFTDYHNYSGEYVVNYTVSKNILAQIRSDQSVIEFTIDDEDFFIFVNKLKRVTIKEIK